MKNKGYTLLELLGVIVILSVLVTLVFPSVINFIKKSNEEKENIINKLIIGATESFMNDNLKDFYSIKGEVYCIPVKDLKENSYLIDDIDENLVNEKTVKITYADKFNYEIVDNNSCKKVSKGLFLNKYQPLEYIQNTGTQYINTGVIPNSNTGVDIVYQAVVVDNASQYIMGTRENAIQYAINGSGSRTDWSIIFGGVSIHSDITRTCDKMETKISMSNGNGTWTLTNLNTNESSNLTITQKTIMSTLPLTLFSFNTNVDLGYSNIHEGLRIYSCKIYDGETLIRDYVPCYRKSDGEAGMYDLVNNKFYENAGSQSFVKGKSEMITDAFLNKYQPVEYIENTGTQYIDTGVIPNMNTGVDIIYQVPTEDSVSKSQYILGSRDTSGNNYIIYAVNGSGSRTDWNLVFNRDSIYSDIPRTTEKWQTVISIKNGQGIWYLKNLDTGENNTISLPQKTFTAIAPIMLFGYNSNNIHSNLRIYSCKIYASEALIRYYVPCYRKSDGEIGMYDLVNDTFYENAGLDSFIKGENVVIE